MSRFQAMFLWYSIRMACFLMGVGFVVPDVSSAQERTWKDKTGEYRINASLVGNNDELAILKKADGELVAFPIKDLSDEDREFLQSEEGVKITQAKRSQTWTFRDGRQVSAEVISHGDKDVVIHQRRGKVYVNDRLFDNLPEAYQTIVPAVVSHFEKREFKDVEDFKRFVVRHGNRKLKYHSEGVILELDNGDEYAVPYFLFSDENRKILEAGREDYRRATTTDRERENHDLYMRSLAYEYQMRRELEQLQIQRLQLGLLATNAGITDMWEVSMIPPNGNFFMAQSVVVFARDSRQASLLASQQWPGYTVGPVRRVNRNW